MNAISDREATVFQHQQVVASRPTLKKLFVPRFPDESLAIVLDSKDLHSHPMQLRQRFLRSSDPRPNDVRFVRAEILQVAKDHLQQLLSTFPIVISHRGKQAAVQ